MSNKKQFHEYLEVLKIRQGLAEDGQVLTVNFTLRVGVFYIKNASYHLKSGSIRMNKRGVTYKPSFHPILKDKIDEAIKAAVKLALDKHENTG